MSTQTWTIPRSKNDSNYLDVRRKIFKKYDNKDFLQVKIFTIAGRDFKQFMWFKSQLVMADENLGREENLFLVPIPAMSKDMDKQPKLADKVVDVVDQANRKIFVTLLLYSVEKVE